MSEKTEFLKSASYSFIFTSAAYYVGMRLGGALHNSIVPDLNNTGIENLAFGITLAAGAGAFLQARNNPSLIKKQGVYAGVGLSLLSATFANIVYDPIKPGVNEVNVTSAYTLHDKELPEMQAEENSPFRYAFKPATQ